MEILSKWILLALTNIVWGQSNPNEYEKFKKFGTLHTMEALMYWSSKEQVIVKLLQERLTHLNKQKDMIIRYSSDYKESSGKALKNLREPNLNQVQRGNVIGSSMVLSHLMTHRYANMISPLRAYLETDAYREIPKKIAETLKVKKNDQHELEVESLENFLVNVGSLEKKSNKVPNWQDAFVSSMAIMHIQEIYGMLPEYFRIGLPIYTNYGGELKASHCAKLGMFALQSFFPFYYNAIEWFELGLKLLDEGNEDAFQRHVLQSLLNLAIQTHNGVYQSPQRKEEAETWVQTYMEPTKHFEEGRLRGRDEYYDYFKDDMPGNSSNDYTRFLGLCGGDSFQTEAEKSNLKCYLERKRHPYFILNPVKTEQLSEYPYIVKMYEVLGNETINNIKTVRGYGALSTIATTMDLSYSLSQRSSVGFTPMSEGMEDRINKITEMITGLVISAVDEQVQVGEYVYGRYYSHHPDAVFYANFGEDTLKKIPRPAGNRLATVLYYVEEPDLGGYTPFCQVGVFSESTVGSAVFWINLFKNGSIRNDVTHAACPIIHGNKIIINRWIGEGDNFLTFPCSLNMLD